MPAPPDPAATTPPAPASGLRRVFGVPWFGVPQKMARRLASATLVGQALAVFLGALVARGFEEAAGGARGTTYLVIGSVLALACLLTPGLLRRPWGITLGWVLQLLTLATGLVVPAMVIVAVVFGALWGVALAQGARLDAMTEDWLTRYLHPDDVPPDDDVPPPEPGERQGGE